MSQKEHFYFVANNVLMLETPKLSLISDKQGPRLITLNHPLSESRQLSIIFPPAIIHYLQLTDISPAPERMMLSQIVTWSPGDKPLGKVCLIGRLVGSMIGRYFLIGR